MDRRTLLRSFTVGATAVAAGCGRYVGNPPEPKRLEIQFRSLRPIDNGYRLSVQLSNNGEPQDTIENATLLAYSESGELVCRKEAGRLNAERLQTNVTVTCSDFPAIITGSSDTSICDGIEIPIIHWTGTDDQKEVHMPEDVPEGVVWFENTLRECDQELPPERLLKNNNETSE